MRNLKYRFVLLSVTLGAVATAGPAPAQVKELVPGGFWVAPAATEIAHVDPTLLETLDAAILEDPDDASAYMQRGLLFNHLEKEDRAIADFSEVIRIAPENVDAYNFRGTLYYRRAQLKRALADFERAIVLAPEFSVLYFNRAYVRRDLGDLEGAIVDFNQGAALAEQQGDAATAAEARAAIAELTTQLPR
ncbi:MAG: tetratricopeptide repeat protein [Cyanobacteria bacterium J06641_5]